MLSPFLYAVVVDVVIEFARERALNELLFADYLVLMSETIEGLRNNSMKLKEAFERKGLKVNHGKTKVMDSGSITMDGMSKSKVDPCWVCSLRVQANSALCPRSGKWMHGRYVGYFRKTVEASNQSCQRLLILKCLFASN